MTLQISQAFNQVKWPGAGDVDDCWVVATLWCANAVAPWLYLQTVPAFRRAAGDPDDGKTDGGQLNEIILGVKNLWPQLRVTKASGWSWNALVRELKRGRPASVAVVSGKLPPRLQYGFAGLHQIAVIWTADRGFRVMNPLQPDRSRIEDIGEDALRAAVMAYGNGSAFAAIFPTAAEAFKTHPLYVEVQPGTYTQAQLDAIVNPLKAQVAELQTALAAENAEDIAIAAQLADIAEDLKT